MSESRLVNSKKTIVATYIKQIITVFLQFASRTVFIYVLGEEYLGIGSLFKNILQFLSLADLGFTTAMAYSFYKPLAEQDENKIAALMNFYKKVYRIIASTILVIGLACIPFLKYIVNTKTEMPLLNLYYIFYLLNTVVSYLCVYKTTLITAAQRGYVLAKLQTIVNVIVTLAQIVMLLVFRNYIMYLVLMVLSTLLQNVYPSMVAGKMFPYINRKVYLDKSEIKSMFANIKSVFIYKVSGKFVTSTDNILISIMIGTAAVGYYSNYHMIIDNITIFVTAIFSSITASVGNLLVSADADSEKRYSTFNIEQVAASMIAIILSTCFGFLANDFIRLWAGERFVLSGLAVFGMSLNFYLTCIFQPLWSYREASGLYKKTKYVNVATAIANVVLSILLGLKFGVGGILIATPISKLLTYFWFEPPILYKDYFKASVKDYYFSIVKSAITIGIIAVCVFVLGSVISVTTWLLWLLKAAVLLGVSLFVVLVVYGRDKYFRVLLSRIKR